MFSLRKKLFEIISEAFVINGYDAKFGEVTVSDRPDLCQFQCNGAFSCAKMTKSNPVTVANKIIEKIEHTGVFKTIKIAGPGFINFILEDEYIAEHVREMRRMPKYGSLENALSKKIVIDYGGPNVGKPLHVGHLRSAIIGESLKRIAKFLGNTVIADVHLGDWGLQMGMIIRELQNQNPEWIYFDSDFTGPYPTESPINFKDFEETYPKASKKAKEDIAIMEECRKITTELQNKRPGFIALWKHFIDISVTDLKKSYDKMFIYFDLWKGESDVQPLIPQMTQDLISKGYAYLSQGAMVVDVEENTDSNPMPPFILSKTDGSSLYSTTDLATILERHREFKPDEIWYVVDSRQALHFKQVFRCAYKTGIIPNNLNLKYLGFGTVNGTDGKPFKTREGGVMKLDNLIKMVEENVLNRFEQEKVGIDYDMDEKLNIAHLAGIAAIKYGDLMNLRTKDYIFDTDKFTSFEGRTGIYLLYSTVRIKSILRKSKEMEIKFDKISSAGSDVERELQLQITLFPEYVNAAMNDNAPNYICDFVYNVASLSNKFYHEHNILKEVDVEKKGKWLALLEFTHEILNTCLDLLGIKVPERI